MYVRGYLQGSENGRVVTIDPLVPLCALIVIGPEVKTQNRCRHL